MIPLFTSAYSFKSILTLNKYRDFDKEYKAYAQNLKEKKQKPLSREKYEAVERGNPSSIIQIARENDLKQFFLVEDNMSAFIQGKNNSGDLQMCYGLRLTFCADANDKSKESKQTECKYVIFITNSLGDDEGYYKLLEIFTKAATDFSMDGHPRMDFKHLKEMWDDKNLTLCVPFYDSFIHKNSLGWGKCIPEFEDFTSPVFFVEDNGLFFEDVIREGIEEFTQGKDYEVIPAKSIYYEAKRDFKAWQTYRAVQNRSSLRMPNLTHCGSDKFCMESWNESR